MTIPCTIESVIAASELCPGVWSQHNQVNEGWIWDRYGNVVSAEEDIYLDNLTDGLLEHANSK